MTRTELEQAMKMRKPVMHLGVKYQYIRRIVLVPNYGSCDTLVTAELVDNGGRSTTIAPAHEILPVGGGRAEKPFDFAKAGIVGMCAICLQPITIGVEISFRQGGKLFHQTCVDADPLAPRILAEKKEARRQGEWIK